MPVQLGEGAREVKLVGKSKLFTNCFDGQIRAVQQLHRALHPQMIQVHQRRVAGHAMENLAVMRAGQIHNRRKRGHAQRLAQVFFHELDALSNAILNVGFTPPEFILVPQDDSHQMEK